MDKVTSYRKLKYEKNYTEKWMERSLMAQDKVTICQWCFEQTPIENSIYCQECIDSFKQQEEENKQFDLEKWLEEV